MIFKKAQMSMNAHLVVLLITLFSSTLKSQDLTIVGHVVEASTQNPVAGATIGVRNKKIFFRTTNDGKFEFMDERLKATDTLTISYLGYKTQHMVIGKVNNPIMIKMEPAVTLLNEVTIGSAKLEVGSEAESHLLTGSFFPDMDAAMFMSGSSRIKGTIHSVGFYIGEGHLTGKGDATAPFRIKIFDVSADGSPGKELTKDVIVTSAKKNNGWLDINVFHYGIKVPKKGFFVCFSLLNYDYYLLGEAYKKNPLITKSIDVITPRIGLAASESKENFCFFRMNKSLYDGKWTKHHYSNTYMIRATISLGN